VSVHVHCNGCGNVADGTAGAYPYGWRRIELRGRQDHELPGTAMLDELDVCSLACAWRALDLHFDPSAGAGLHVVGDR